jgi:hypothetical protein
LLQKLDAISIGRLFGDGLWLLESVLADPILDQLCDLGLLESTAPTVSGWRIARFGAEVQADLWLALMSCQSAENTRV